MRAPGGPRQGLENERFMILQMVQDGSISPDEGARLLEAMDRAERTAPIPAPPVPPTMRDVHILITNQNGENELDLVLPFGLVEMGLNLADKFAPGRLPDLTEIRRSIREGFTGTLFNIDNGSNHIKIIIEER